MSTETFRALMLNADEDGKVNAAITDLQQRSA